ncbi:MICOS complex subunit MIC19 isoform X3 [Acipenser ruthenus]|uniref:MICOS complex subunit MIC19 isoform X3 n=1 Tax=Acipenser ruthenus TaxID=7906 RepID=UPI0027422B6E|nr:MICOS complex subunit MIC19 isoform X3 [Acipenser ruthenus]
MGGNSSTRRVSFEADENDNITVVKGIRLSENVINRMREPAPSLTRPPPLTPESSVSLAVKEEQLRKRISDELEIERAKRDTDLHKKLEQDKTFVREEINKVLERERAAANESISRAVLRETVTTEEERLKTKRFSAQFYKVTTEQYQKSVTEVEAKFKRYESHPVCADLQGEILRCYQASNGQTLSCSTLARQYLQCVNNAKQSMLRKGG